MVFFLGVTLVAFWQLAFYFVFTLVLVCLYFLWLVKAVLFTPRWLFEGLGRDKAEELLQLPDTKIGSFMIRESETKKGKPFYFYFLTCGHPAHFALTAFLWVHSPSPTST